nr:putative ribonuclease H-like domain-containing protein [Tanacetum cinerariifolium]
MHKAFPLPVTEFPLPEELPTAREDSYHCQKKREATARKIALLSMLRRNCQSKVAVTLKYIQRKKNDVKARTTLLLSLPDEHQLRFSNGSQIKFEDINQIDEDDMEEIDVKWNMALLSMRADKGQIKDGLGYSDVPPPPAQLYLSLMKDLSWTGLPECADDTVTHYSRPSPTVESASGDDQNRNPSVSKTVASPITPKPFIKFVKPKDNQSKSKTGKTESHKKHLVKNFPTANRKFPTGSIKCPTADMGMKGKADSGYSRHMTGNISYLSDYEPFTGVYVSFGQGGCKITGKGTIKTGKLEFVNVYFVKDLNIRHKWYCLVVTDDFSTFTWTFFLKSKDETSGILKKFITELENLKDLKVKIIRCDNGGEFRNKEMNDFCSQKGIKREFSNAGTPQQIGVTERRNRTLIEVARTMLADAQLPVTFCTEVPKDSRNLNPIASTSTPPAGQMETLTVETSIPTISSLVPTAYSTDSQKPSSDARLISKRVANQEETPSLDNILSLSNRFEDILGVT